MQYLSFLNENQEMGHYPTGLSPSLSMSNMQLSNQPSSYDCHYRSQYSTVVLRRGQAFFMSVRMKERNFDPRRDVLRVTFTFGTFRSKISNIGQINGGFQSVFI